MRPTRNTLTTKSLGGDPLPRCPRARARFTGLAARSFVSLSLVLPLASCSSGASGDDVQSQSEGLATGTYENPLLGAQPELDTTQCPDPNVRQYGANYFMVCTSDAGGRANAFPIHWSSDLVHWHFIAYVFTPALHPSWARAPGSVYTTGTSTHLTDYWAPEINRSGGKWILTFAATKSGTTAMAVGVATADAIAGPWTASSEPLVAPGDGSIPGPGDANSGRIDASLLREPISGDLYHDPNTNNLYLYYVYQPRWVHVTQLTSDGLSVVKGADRELQLTGGGAFTATLAWEKTTIEGVEAHFVDGQVVLLYSGAGTWDGTYAVGAARSSSPEGPFTKHGDPILQTKPEDPSSVPGTARSGCGGPTEATTSSITRSSAIPKGAAVLVSST